MRKFEFSLWVFNAFIHVLSFASGSPVSWFSYFCTLLCLLLHLWLEVREERRRELVARMLKEITEHFDNKQ